MVASTEPSATSASTPPSLGDAAVLFAEHAPRRVMDKRRKALECMIAPTANSNLDSRHVRIIERLDGRDRGVALARDLHLPRARVQIGLRHRLSCLHHHEPHGTP